MKKAQLQSMETIIVIVLLMILILFGLQFYSNVTQQKITSLEQSLAMTQLDAITLQSSFFPELDCHAHNAITTICIDELKLDIVRTWLADVANPDHDALRLRYFERFGSAEVAIIPQYPEHANKIVLYSSLDPDQDSFTKLFPMLLYDPLTNSNTLAVLYVEVNS